jgi:Do/DeqQ family serine protease
LKTNGFPHSGLVIIAVSVVLLVGFGILLGRTVLAPQTAEISARENLPSQETHLARNETFVANERLGAIAAGAYPSFREVVNEILPTVVEIDVVKTVEQPGTGSPFEFFFRPRSNRGSDREQFQQQGLGSGVIVKRTGNRAYVLTNNHVVGDADEIEVTLYDGRSFRATLVGGDPKKDLALVVFEANEDVPLARLGDSDGLYPGDWVLAVGNPLGFESTVTAGIVSAIGRDSMAGSSIAGFTDFIQTDAAINQGNSGGALVNTRGEVVGINTWIASSSGGSIGIGFAIPINNAKRAIQDFITKGRVDYGWLGVSMGDLSPELSEDLNLETASGAFVYGVFKGSPGHRGGLQPGDYITSVDNDPISSSGQLLRKIGELAPGEVTQVIVRRGKDTISLTVTLESRGSEQDIAALSKKVWPGFSAIPITEEMQKELKLQSGRVIIRSVDPDSSADVAGLKAGDVIRSINGKPLSSVGDFYKHVNDRNSRELNLEIYRQGSSFSVGLKG